MSLGSGELVLQGSSQAGAAPEFVPSKLSLAMEHVARARGD